MDKNFVKSLEPPLLELLPTGAIQELSNEFDITRQNISKIVRGEWTNVPVIKKAIEIIRREQQDIEVFLAQIPSEILETNVLQTNAV